MLLLQIAGGILVGLLLLILVAYLFLRSKFRKLLDFESQNGTPLAIRLNEDLAPDWTEEPSAKVLITDLEALGFRRGKSYIVHEMDGVLLQSMFSAPYAAVVYLHAAAGSWVDIVFHAEDGTEITAASAPTGGEISHRPDEKKIFKPGATPAELLEAIKHETRGKGARALDDSNFRDVFETAYKKDMAWRASQGGTTMEEFLEVAGNMDKKFSDEEMREAFLETKVQELHQWHAACVEEFMKSESLPWDSPEESAEYELFIVPTKTDAKAYVHYLADIGLVEEERKEKLAGAFPDNQEIPAMFQRINDSFHEDLRAKLVGHTEYPVKADVYRLAAAGNTDC